MTGADPWLRAAHAVRVLNAIHDEASGLLDMQFVMGRDSGVVFEAERAGVEAARPLAEALRHVMVSELTGQPAVCLGCAQALGQDYSLAVIRSQAPEPKSWLSLTACGRCAPGLDQLRALVVAAVAEVLRLRPIHEAGHA